MEEPLAARYSDERANSSENDLAMAPKDLERRTTTSHVSRESDKWLHRTLSTTRIPGETLAR